ADGRGARPAAFGMPQGLEAGRYTAPRRARSFQRPSSRATKAPISFTSGSSASCNRFLCSYYQGHDGPAQRSLGQAFVGRHSELQLLQRVVLVRMSDTFPLVAVASCAARLVICRAATFHRPGAERTTSRSRHIE